MNRFLLGAYAVNRRATFPGLHRRHRVSRCNVEHTNLWIGLFPVGGRRLVCWYR